MLPAVPNDQCKEKAKLPRTKKHTKRNGQNFKVASKPIVVQKEPEVVPLAIENFPDARLEV
jgi:hypothetical protein